MKTFGTLFSVLFCSALFLFKVTAVHSYTHHDTDEVETCLVCNVYLEQEEEAVVLPAQPFSIRPVPHVAFTEPMLAQDDLLVPLPLTTHIMSRPPPALV
ncbi:hypothetical protein [Maribacter sp. 2307ULW6-5]|uniref:hypothetical protein n=1 Tax=Maribacter sp. 2307ULW6-5 TaxID=3386275 RepID=UPI0039BD778C